MRTMLPEPRGSARPPAPVALATLVLLCCLLGGCVSYAAQAVSGQWQLMRARRPIARVVKDPATTPRLQARLRLVEQARDFAVSDLGLPDNRSYRSYADLQRPYAVWNVVATPEFSVQPRRWCFPFTGCISYRGYFRERSARAYAARLAARGDDVLVEGVSAYSTLGHFADPVLNTMLRYGDADLVGTVFHELAHQLIYVRGDSEFDESFAMTVEEEGLRRWFTARGRPDELQRFLAGRRGEQAVVHAFAAGRAQLAALYAMPLGPTVMRERKHALLVQIGQRAQSVERQYGLRTAYDDWIAGGLNNAHLAAIGTYYDCVPGFRRLLAAADGSLPAFYDAVRARARSPAARRALCGADSDGA